MNSITTNREFFSEFFGEANEDRRPLGGSRLAAGRPGPAAPLPGGLGGRPLRCRATGPSGASAQILSENFCRKAPAAPQRGDGPGRRQWGSRVIFL